MSLLLVPATRENLEKSIERTVDVDYVRKYLPPLFVDEIVKFSGIEGIRCWAMTKNSAKLFSEIKKGDEVLFTEKQTGKFTHYGVVIGKVKSDNFGKALWPFVGDNPWENIYFLANITNINLSKKDIVSKLGYSEKFMVPGPIRVKDVMYSSIKSISRKYEIPVYENVAEVNEENKYYGENVKSIGTRRKGHGKFSREVKKNYNYSCAICGISEPEFLIAGHISPWAEDEINRLNPENGICL